MRRNPMALLTALGTPLVGVVLLNAFPPRATRRRCPAPAIVVTLTAFALLFPLYYNLVTTLVARREELVLKRLRSGECSDREILIGAGRTGGGHHLVAVSRRGGRRDGAGRNGRTGRPVSWSAAVVLGTVVFVLLAAASTAMTRTVEMAQLSTLPVVVVSMVLGGLFPPDMLPGPLHWVAQVLPLTQVVDLMWLGLTGTTRDGPGGLGGPSAGSFAALLVLGAWVAPVCWPGVASCGGSHESDCAA